MAWLFECFIDSFLSKPCATIWLQVLRHNSDTQRDVSKLQQELHQLAAKQAKQGASSTYEVDTAMATVSTTFWYHGE